MLDNLAEEVHANLARPFTVAGRRCYLIGQMDGAFPDLGHHLPGEMGGLWVPPIKLADGFWLGLRAAAAPVTWMYGPTCRTFQMRPGRIARDFALPVAGGTVHARQELFVPEHESGLLIHLTLTNAGDQDLALTLHWLVRFDLQAAWWSNWPDRPDVAHFDPATGTIQATDSLHPAWAAAMAGDRAPATHALGPDLWAAEQTSSLQGGRGPGQELLRNPAELQGQGISGRLDYALTLAAGSSQTLRFAIAGGSAGAPAAQRTALSLLARHAALLAAKLTALATLVAAAPVVESPRPDLNRVFALSTLCTDLLTLELPDVGRGIVAGFPGFAWFFGCDTYYTVSGLLIAGQAETALATLRLLAGYARRQGGRIPHEITPTGAVFNPGNTVETGEFVTAVERAYRWTADRAFLDDVYPVCRSGIFDYMLGECDPHGDLLPDGPGILELSSAHHGKKLDVACSLFQGLHSLAYLAAAVGDGETAARSRDLAGRVRDQIERYFWVPAREEYVWRIEPDLSVDPAEPAHSYAVLEMGVLDDRQAERIARLAARVEGPDHTGPAGVIHPGTAGFVMPIQNAIVALAEFRYGRPDPGLWYLERMAELCGHYMPWAIPEFVGAEACFLQAWSSAAFNWLLVQGCLRLQPDPAGQRVVVQPQLPRAWDHLTVRNLTIWGRRCDLRLQRTPAGIICTVQQPPGDLPELQFEIVPVPALPAGFV
ncbi:MAG TPA: hypothetical protein VKY74_01495 [Chloroflexia bacterium]|nr:hypothetical protein [Chloroflexia bacterium]